MQFKNFSKKVSFKSCTLRMYVNMLWNVYYLFMGEHFFFTNRQGLLGYKRCMTAKSY